MYILVRKDREFVGIYKEKSELSKEIGKVPATIRRNLVNGRYETEKFVVYQPDFVQNKSKRGGYR